MEGKNLVTILGLVLVQAVAAVLVGTITGSMLFEGVVALIFLVSGASFLLLVRTKRASAMLLVLLVFALGLIHVVYLSFVTATLWLVVMLCLDAAGFILALDLLEGPKKSKASVPRKGLPLVEKPKVIVYDVTARKSVKRAKTKKRSTAKRMTKKTAKTSSKKTARKSVRRS